MEVKKDKQKESQSCSITAFVKRLSTVVTLDEKEEKYNEKITQTKKRCQEETRNLEKRFQDESIKINKFEQEIIIKINKRCQEEMRKLEKISQEEIMKIKKILQDLTRKLENMSQDEIIMMGIRDHLDMIKRKNMCPEIIREAEKLLQDGKTMIKDVGQEEIRNIEKIGQEQISNFEKANKDEIRIWERYQDEIVMIKKVFKEDKMNDLQARVDQLDQEAALARDSKIFMMEKLRQLEEAIYELKLDKNKNINEIKAKLECFEPEKHKEEVIVKQMLGHMTYLRKEQFKMKENMLELVETCQQFESSLHQSEKRSENLCYHLNSLIKYDGFHPSCNSDKYNKTCSSQGKTILKDFQDKHDEDVEVIAFVSKAVSLSEEDVSIRHNEAPTINCYKQSKLCATTKEFKPQSHSQEIIFNDPPLIFVPQPPIVHAVFSPCEQPQHN